MGSGELSTASSSNSHNATVALGNTWSHCVNTRLIVQYVDDVSREVIEIITEFTCCTNTSADVVSVKESPVRAPGL